MTSLIVENENSYITIEDAEDYFTTRLFSNFWDTANDTEKEKALITATKRIDAMRFNGFVCAQDQPLQFPRYVYPNYLSKHTYTDKINMASYNGQEVVFVGVTKEIKEAVCEEAIALLDYGNSVHLKNQALGVSSVSFGGVSNSYKPNSNDLLSTTALKLIDKYIQKTGRVI